MNTEEEEDVVVAAAAAMAEQKKVEINGDDEAINLQEIRRSSSCCY